LNGKNYLVAVLLSSMIIALMFIPMSGSQTTAQYDPWADINDDGIINLKDTVYTILLFNTKGDPTNVNVTNWMPPKPKTVFYCTWNLYWEDGSLRSSRVGPLPDLYVGDYTKITILLKIDNLFLEYGDALFTVYICWKEPTIGIVTSETLSSTLVLLRHDPINQLQGWSQISTASYTIKAPYLSLEPLMVNLADKHKGNATMSAYIYLTYGTLEDSTSKTIEYSVNRLSSSDYESFSAFLTKGYRQITLRIWTNVSCNVVVVDYQTWSSIDSFSKGYGWVMKTYEVTTPSIEIRFLLPSSKPWYIDIMVYMTT